MPREDYLQKMLQIVAGNKPKKLQTANQNFVCAICHGDDFAMNDCHSGVLVVDHDHETGKVRGLVCHNCNRALGLLHDDVDNFRRAISYLERVTTIPKGSTVQADGAGSGGH